MSNKLIQVAENHGAVVVADNKTHTNRMEIRSESSNRVYIVAQAKTSGEWQCSCPGWIMKKPNKPRGCKHLNAMLPSLQAATQTQQQLRG